MANLVDLAQARAERLPASTVVTITFTDVGAGQYAVAYETHDRGDGWHASPGEIAATLRRVAGEMEAGKEEG